MVEWKFQDNAECPRCHCASETTEHVQKCHGHGADDEFEKSLTTLEGKLDTLRTRPDITQAIIYCYRQWRNNKPLDTFRFPPDIRQAVLEQRHIGWLAMIEGSASKLWRELQGQHYRRNSMRRSSRKWIKALLKQLHHLGFKQWQHRNHIKQTVTKPAAREAISKLNAEIAYAIAHHKQHLLPGDKRTYRASLFQLLRKPVETRKHWLTNFNSAYQRAMRKKEEDDELNTTTKGMATLIDLFKRKVI